MKKTLILDSSQIQAYTECPEYWYLSRVLNIVPAESRVDEHSTPAVQGSYGHKLLERYYKSLAKNTGLKDSMDWALSVRADEICENCGHDLKEHIKITAGDINPAKEIWECTNTGCICVNPSASKVEITEKERLKVAKRFQDYCYTYSANELRPPNPACVEVGFSYPLYEDDQHYFVLEGKIDLFQPTRKEIKYGFVDHKFQLRERNLYKKSIQFRNYGLVSNAQIALINYIRLKEKIDNTTLMQVPITYALGEHEWWKQKLIRYYFEISLLLENRDSIPKNWGMCSGMFGYECDYTQLCNERDEGMKSRMQAQLYKIKPEWKPW